MKVTTRAKIFYITFTLFVIGSIVTIGLFQKKINHSIQRVENNVFVTNYYYFEMTNREEGSLLGDLTPHLTVLDKTLRKYKDRTYKVEELNGTNLDYHFSDDWLFLIPRETTNNYLTPEYSTDIIIEDAERLRDYFLTQRFISYESLKMEIYTSIGEFKGFVNTPTELQVLNSFVNKKLYSTLGIKVNIIKN